MAEFDSMTVNERLLVAGLLEDFDAAVASEDLSSINAILAKVGLRQDENGMNWALEEQSQGSRKTLGLKDTSDAEQTLNKKGRGWKISDKRLDELHDRAREMRRFASPANKALAAKFAGADLGRYTFKRFAVVGSAIVDFNCHNLGMAIMIDEEDADEAISKRRDKSLEAVGIRVMRIKASDIIENMDAVLQRITAGMRMRIDDKQAARRAHYSNNSAE
ncbi:MAG: DUF559 domain-containing protein [Pseudomonadota bacterium]